MIRDRLVLGGLWTATLSAVILGWIGLVHTDRLLKITGGQIVFVTLVALATPVLATAMSRRRASETSGVLVGVSVLLAALGSCRSAALGHFVDVAGPMFFVAALLPAVVIARYPGLQLSPHRARLITILAVVAGGLGAAASGLALARGAVPNPWWVTAHPASAGAVATTVLAAHTVVVIAGAGLTAAGLLTRYRAGSRPVRGALRPLVFPAFGWAVSVAVTSGWTFYAGVHTPHLLVYRGNAGTAFVLVPAVLVGAVAAGIAWLDLFVRRPDGSAGVLAEIGSEAVAVERYLARALADPSVRVVYPLAPDATGSPSETTWVDGSGRLVEPAIDDPQRAMTIIQREGVVIGMIEQDVATASRPDAVELVATGAGLMMETERLAAGAQRDLETSRLLATRLLSATEEPREQLRAQLVDGPLAELNATAVALGAGLPLAAALPKLTAISANVRAISHGVFPAALAAEGLTGALGRGTINRYPPLVEMTVYLIAHDDPDAVIVEHAHGLQITTVPEPTEQVRDRITALGGQARLVAVHWTIEIPTETVGR